MRPALLLTWALSTIETVPPVTGLNERTVFIEITPTINGGERFRMQYTLYHPDGPGPFPVAVVNHGRSRDPGSQPVDRPTVLARELVARGYAVVAPMRRGFAGTPGNYMGNGCLDHGRMDGDRSLHLHDWDVTDEVFDLRAFIDAIVDLHEIDRSRIVMFSQSGGFTSTLGYMTAPRSGVLGYINFVGGGFDCVGRQDLSLGQAGEQLGGQVKRPGLWIYARQDSFVPAAAYHVMFDSFVAAGGDASWIELAPHIKEGHYMLGNKRAVSVWWPHVETFLRRLGLPTEVRYRVTTVPPNK
jgi:dienelactone hydrolase